MKSSIYKYIYWKDFNNIIVLRDNTYPEYRKRLPKSGGEIFINYCNIDKVTINNRNIVLYPSYLIKNNNCYINIGYCALIKALKYIFKLVIKGHNFISIALRNENNKTR